MVPCVTSFYTVCNRSGNRRASRLPWEGGNTSFVRWVLRLVIFAVKLRHLLDFCSGSVCYRCEFSCFVLVLWIYAVQHRVYVVLFVE